MTRKTVREFIKESKPDWEPVARIEKRADTGSFSGAPVVRVGSLTTEPFVEQMKRFDRQVFREEPVSFFDEPTEDQSLSTSTTPGSSAKCSSKS